MGRRTVSKPRLNGYEPSHSVPEATSRALQQSRDILYELRMDTPAPDFVRHFFAELNDASEILALFDFLPDVYLYVKDTQGRFIRVNRAMTKARGLKHESELIGKTDLDIHPPYWAMRYRDEDQRVVKSGERLVDQVWLVPNSEGRLESYLSTKIPLFDRQGRCIGIAGVRRPLHASAPESRGEQGLETAARTITERYSEPLTIRELAKLAGLSHSQFNRRFLATYRMSPSQYVQRVRVHEASRLLGSRDESISFIALATGFYDQAHLTRTFKKVLGITPSEFRRINREDK